MECAQVDKSEKRVSQEKEEPTEEDVYDDTMVEKKASVQLPGLKLARVILVIRVTCYLGQVGLTRFIKYPGLTQILNWITCVNNGVWS